MSEMGDEQRETGVTHPSIEGLREAVEGAIKDCICSGVTRPVDEGPLQECPRHGDFRATAEAALVAQAAYLTEHGVLLSGEGLVRATSDEQVKSVQQWMTLQLWLALRLDSEEFVKYIELEGWADTWARLLGCVRGVQTPCATWLGDDQWCVFEEGHSGPHYGPADVGKPNDLLGPDR